MKRWYVARTHPQGEAKAVSNLLRQGFLAYLPRYLKRRRHARRVDMVAAPLFPRYLFINFDVTAARWRAISSTIGIDRLICAEDTPMPVPDGVIEDIKAREGEDGYVPVGCGAGFARGEPVQILSGALSDHVGLFDCPSDEQRVFVLLNLLGRQVRVRVPLDTVAAAV